MTEVLNPIVKEIIDFYGKNRRYGTLNKKLAGMAILSQKDSVTEEMSKLISTGHYSELLDRLHYSTDVLSMASVSQSVIIKALMARPDFTKFAKENEHLVVRTLLKSEDEDLIAFVKQLVSNSASFKTWSKYSTIKIITHLSKIKKHDITINELEVLLAKAKSCHDDNYSQFSSWIEICSFFMKSGLVSAEPFFEKMVLNQIPVITGEMSSYYKPKSVRALIRAVRAARKPALRKVIIRAILTANDSMINNMLGKNYVRYQKLINFS